MSLPTLTKTTSALQLVVLKTCDKQEQYHFARGYLRDVTIISISCVLSILCDIDKLYYRYCELVYAIVIVNRLPVIIFYVTTPQLPASSLLGSESWSSSATFPSSASPSAGCLLLVCSSSSSSSPCCAEADDAAAPSGCWSCSTHLLRGCWSRRRWGSSRMACLT